MQAFLRDEFNEENAIFWQKCEQYRKYADTAYRKQLARQIYADHVAESSADQVNIDADVRQTVERRLSTATVNLFDEAQRQVYLLMKYDPYPRYVKMRRNAETDVLGLLPPPFEELDGDSDGEKEVRRWSLLPNWLAERRRRHEVETSTCRRQTGGSGLTRFIKRLSHGDRKTCVPPPPASAQRRNDSNTSKPSLPTTPCASRPVPPPPTLTGTKRNATVSSRALGTPRRSTSVLGLNSVGTAHKKTQNVTRLTAQRTIRYR